MKTCSIPQPHLTIRNFYGACTKLSSAVTERCIIIEKLKHCNWNQTDAAEQFHTLLSTLKQKIKRLNIEMPRLKPVATLCKVACAPLRSFIAQRDHRINPRRSARRHIGSKQCDRQEQDRDAGKGHYVDGSKSVEQRMQEPRNSDRKHQPYR